MEAIHKCAYYNNIEGIRDKINNGIDVNKACDVLSPSNNILFYGVNPLHLACQRGHVNVVRFLMERGGDPTLNMYNTKLRSYDNSFYMAFLFGNLKCLYYLKNVKKKTGLLI